ncbi:MAG: molybdate ABC transporter substrate-binding protein [Myxococcales bacterium FL481]|nr:MAG: molybdate ABC transporter substrate-binding protein [Myxococcales bacterium FL481]
MRRLDLFRFLYTVLGSQRPVLWSSDPVTAPQTYLRPLAWLLPVIATGCRSGAHATTESVELTVFAASSLTEVLGAIETDFERAHPQVDVQTVFAGSQVLRLQIQHGAAADVLLPADPSYVEDLSRRGLVTTSRTVAHNELVLAVSPRSAPDLRRFGDLERAERIVLGSRDVPVGAYAETILSAAAARYGAAFVNRVRQRVVSREHNTRLVRAKVEMGEADAAIIYRTDVLASDRLKLVPIPPELNLATSYPVAVLSDAPHPDDAATFAAFLETPAAAITWQRYGFTPEVP